VATFILIHGAWHGGWCFDPIRPLLEAQGHVVVTPDLPGMGGNEAERAAVTLAGWADFVAGLCEDAAQPVILCGHSRGGIVISEAAERVPDKVAALVYICAMLLPNGVSRADMRAEADPNPAFDALKSDIPFASVADPALAPAVFAQLSPPDLVQSAVARLVAEPSAPTSTRLQLSDARYGSVPRHYIECFNDRTITINDQRRMQARVPCDSVITLDADHSPFLSRPRELADALLAIGAQKT
jgi:pimeloyl-ACP methyl ester carboxylesterase